MVALAGLTHLEDCSITTGNVFTVEFSVPGNSFSIAFELIVGRRRERRRGGRGA